MQPVEDAQAEKSDPTRTKRNEPESPKNWLEETEEIAKPFKQEVQELQEKADYLTRECIDQKEMYESEPMACYQALKALQKVDDAKERARRAGVPVQWMDEW